MAFQLIIRYRLSYLYPLMGKMASLKLRHPPKKTRRGLMIKSSQKRAATLPQTRRQPKRRRKGQLKTHKKDPRNLGQHWQVRVMNSNLLILPRWSSSSHLDSLWMRLKKWHSLSSHSRKVGKAKRSLVMLSEASFPQCLAPKKFLKLSLRGPSPCSSSLST
jgi:hypothetical protein